MGFLQWVVDYFDTPPWTDHEDEVFVAAAIIQVFLAAIMMLVVSALMIEMRNGPFFITRLLLAILVETICIQIVQFGVMFHFFDSSYANCVATMIFCTYIFLDIEIYWVFASRYFDVSMHLKTKLDQIECDDPEEQKKISSKMKEKSQMLFYLRIVYSVFCCLAVFGWGFIDCWYEVTESEAGK